MEWLCCKESLQIHLADYIQAAQAASIPKRVTVHTLRHSFATQLLVNGVDIRQIQELLGQAHVETTMIYTHVARGLRAPATASFRLRARSLHP